MATNLHELYHNYGSDDAENGGKLMKKASSFLVVAAIDFGTTYSGYAYSLKSEYEKEHLKVYTNEQWSASGEMLSLKAPTTVLFDKNGKFHSFGYKAESEYTKLAEKEKHDGWQYFSRFKMKLYERKITKTMLLKDDQGKPKKAIEVFSATISYLTDHLMTRLKARIDNILLSDVLWVLTVPAIWDDSAKQFMEECAKMAGIPEAQFTLALEPECAAIYCKEIDVQKAKETKQAANLKSFDPGAKFMVIDLGGGTVDITAHEVNSSGTLKELIPPTGGPWGGTVVDAAFIKFLEKMFTKKVVDEFIKDCKSDHLDLVRRFETKKRAVSCAEDDVVTINPPLALLEVFDEVTNESFASSLKQSHFSETVKKKRDKLICDSKLFVDLFKDPKEKVIKHLRALLLMPAVQNVKTLLLVGGFSESEIISEAIRKEFKEKRVILPNDAGLAVVKGAVMYGFNADSISSRKMPCTYGISAAVPFDDKIHPDSKKVIRYGIAKCEDIFKVFVEKGKEVVPDKTFVENTFNCPYLGAPLITIEIYKSDQEQPKFIDDKGTRKVGELNLQLHTSSSNQVQTIDVKMMFGKTQLEVQAREHGRQGEPVKAKFDFLSY